MIARFPECASLLPGYACYNLRGPQVTRMTLVKMHDEAFNPIDIGLFRANAVMLDANPGADLVEELGLSGRRGHGNLRWMKNVQLINTKC